MREGAKRYAKGTSHHDLRREVSAAMLDALRHPIRREALRVINTACGPISPKEISDELGLDLPNVSFHVRVLYERRLIKITEERGKRGAIEHFYESVVAENELLGVLLDGTEEDDRLVWEEA